MSQSRTKQDLITAFVREYDKLFNQSMFSIFSTRSIPKEPDMLDIMYAITRHSGASTASKSLQAAVNAGIFVPEVLGPADSFSKPENVTTNPTTDPLYPISSAIYYQNQDEFNICSTAIEAYYEEQLFYNAIETQAQSLSGSPNPLGFIRTIPIKQLIEQLEHQPDLLATLAYGHLQEAINSDKVNLFIDCATSQQPLFNKLQQTIMNITDSKLAHNLQNQQFRSQ